MWININTDEIYRRAKQITVSGITYPHQAFRDSELLLSLGIKKYSEVSPDQRYYEFGQLTKVDNGTEVVGTYEAIPRDVATVQERMINDLNNTAKNKELEPIVDSGLGYKVHGKREDLDSFERGSKRGLTEVRDVDGIKRAVTPTQMAEIATAIETSGLALFNTKWTKFDEIKALATIEDCILYEATPYIYTYTQEDIDEMTYIDEITGLPVLPTIQVGDTEDRVRNNVREW